MKGYHALDISVDGSEIEGSKIVSTRDGRNDRNFQSFGALRYFDVFYINFHEVKKEISTQKTSWGHLKSFLAKHIKKLVSTDDIMENRKPEFQQMVMNATKKVLEGGDDEQGSLLFSFIKSVEKNYSENLRRNDCHVNFSLPEYEDIFLQMLFKIGLNGDATNLVPINHFGDGFISMFVMAVIQAIADGADGGNRCLFLFEEPESFLHENHQEYFYKMVICRLAEKHHQVIYTTHSDRIVNLFDMEGLIRLEAISIGTTLKEYIQP